MKNKLTDDRLYDATYVAKLRTELAKCKEEIRLLLHYKNTTVGLWATDKEPEDLTYYWQLEDYKEK